MVFPQPVTIDPPTHGTIISIAPCSLDKNTCLLQPRVAG